METFLWQLMHTAKLLSSVLGWSISFTNLICSQLSSSSPHPTSTCFSFSLLCSQWLAWPDAQAPAPLSPVLLPTYSIHHQSLIFTLKELSHMPVHFVPSHRYNSSCSHHHFPQGMEQPSLNNSPWTQPFSLSSGNLFAE